MDRVKWLVRHIVLLMYGYFHYLLVLKPNLLPNPRWLQACAFRSWKIQWLLANEYTEATNDLGDVNCPFGLVCHSMCAVFKGAFLSTSLGVLRALRTTNTSNCSIVRTFISRSAWTWLRSLKNTANVNREIIPCVRFVSQCMRHTESASLTSFTESARSITFAREIAQTVRATRSP